MKHKKLLYSELERTVISHSFFTTVRSIWEKVSIT
jgi:hypothetical protein